MKHLSETNQRTDAIWGETLIVKPDFKVHGQKISFTICEKYLSLWIETEEGDLVIKYIYKEEILSWIK